MGGYVSGNELTVMAPAAVVEEELVTDKLEPAYHEVPAFDLAADDDQDGFSNEAELLVGTDYADPASYPIAEDELVTEKGNQLITICQPLSSKYQLRLLLLQQ
ncbi:hypothetical protein HO409_07630 [Streptococcus suis]|nr:hypothetical protein [Streptococcus suis]NQM38753.1 hypothetical protein [Streptococcus suis]NQO46654.1 hypothetical protein [Streptococcus suis]WNF83957.1 hypothetical protein RJW52_09645 [Streptococcus suis]